MKESILAAEEIFHLALECSDARERHMMVEQAVKGDLELEEQVNRLLRGHAEAEAEFLEVTPVERARAAGTSLDPELVAKLAYLRPEQEGDLIGPYKLLQQLGEGGFGVVWMARQESPVRRTVAIKIIKLGMDTREVIGRFQQERQALALMDHPGIAKVLDAGATPTGRPFFAMELVRGIPITQYCQDHQVCLAERLRLFIQACSAVQHAHQKGIIHRDLKPSNILVAMQDGAPVPKVIDFGIAKAINGKLTDNSVVTEFECTIGTLLYMPPEQAEMNTLDVDTRCDVYALGVILYELLTERTPFNAEELSVYGNWEEKRRIIREKEPPKPSTALSSLGVAVLTGIAKHQRTHPPALISSLKGDLDWIVMRAMEKDRTRRYPTAESFAQDVERHLNNEAVLARPASSIYRFQRMVRRNRAAFASAAAVAAALVIGAAVSTRQAMRAIEAERVAEVRLLHEDVALKKAEAAEGDTEAFGKFLVERVLAAARPQDVNGGLGVDVTVARALEEAENQLEQDFAGRPLAKARARNAIGVTWDSLGRYESARRQLQQALDLRERYLGPDHADTLVSANDLAVVLSKNGELDKARELHEKVYEKRRGSLARNDPRMLTTLNNLGGVYLQSGKPDQAVILYGDVLERSKEVLAPDDTRTLRTMTSLASAYRAMGDPTRAIELYKEAWIRSSGKLAPTHPYVATIINNLAVACEQAGSNEEARSLYELSLLLSEMKLTAKHIETLTCMSNLAGILVKMNQLKPGVELYGRALNIARGLSDVEPFLLQTITSLAVAYEMQGDFAHAVPLYEEALRLREKMLPPDDPATLKNMNNLGVAQEGLGNLKEALQLYEKVLKKRRSWPGSDDADTRKSMYNVGHAYAKLGDADRSLRQLEELAAAQQVPGSAQVIEPEKLAHEMVVVRGQAALVKESRIGAQASKTEAK